MGRIKDIIDKYYKEIADHMLSCKDKKDYINKDMEQSSYHYPYYDYYNTIFYNMLDNVGIAAEMTVCDNGKFHFIDFFEGHFFIDFGSIGV